MADRAHRRVGGAEAVRKTDGPQLVVSTQDSSA